MIDNLNSTVAIDGFKCPNLSPATNNYNISDAETVNVYNLSVSPYLHSSLVSNGCINDTSISDYIDEDEVPNESNDFEYPDLTQLNGICALFIVLYTLVIIASILGNLIVACTVICNRKMQTVVNYYIVNLALCDFLIGFFVAPIKLIELTTPASWSILNDNLCTALLYLQTVIVFTSVLTLVAICFERYFAVVHPLKSRVHQSKSRTIKILHGVWYVPLIAAGPFLMPSKAYPNTLTSSFGTIERLTCFTNFSPSFRSKYYTCLFIFFYLLPLLLIGWTCSQIARCLIKQTILQREGLLRRQEVNRRKVAKMILVVVFAFTISWTPYFLVTIVTQYQEVNFMSKHNYFFTMLCINLFAFLNSSINPLIYVLMSTRFRIGFTNILRLAVCISSRDELEDSDRIVSNDQNHNCHHNHHSGHQQINSHQQHSHQTEQQQSNQPDDDSSSKVKSLTTKYRHRLVMLICGHVGNQLSTDSGLSESSPPASGYLPDKPTEEVDDDDLGKRRSPSGTEFDVQTEVHCDPKISTLDHEVNSRANYLPKIKISTNLQQPNNQINIKSSVSPFDPPLIDSDCIDDSNGDENTGIYLNDWNKRRYSDNLLVSTIADQLNQCENDTDSNCDCRKLIDTPLNQGPLMVSGKVSPLDYANDNVSYNNSINHEQFGPINYNRSKSESHFVTTTQL